MGVFRQGLPYEWLDCILFLSQSLQALNIATCRSCQITARRAKQNACSWELQNLKKNFLTSPSISYFWSHREWLPVCRDDMNIMDAIVSFEAKPCLECCTYGSYLMMRLLR